MVIKCLCIVRATHIFCCLAVLFWRWAMEPGVKGRVWDYCATTGLLFRDRLVLGQRWMWLPVWLCAGARQPRLCLSVGPSGRRAHPGSGAAHMAHHTPGSCQHPEPAITHTMVGVCVCKCVCSCVCILYFGENWHFSCFTAEWCKQTAQAEWGNSSSVDIGTIYFMWLMQQQTRVPVSARERHAQWG